MEEAGADGGRHRDWMLVDDGSGSPVRQTVRRNYNTGVFKSNPNAASRTIQTYRMLNHNDRYKRYAELEGRSQ